MYADLRKGIDFEIDKDDRSIKMVEKRTRTTKCCPSLISATNRFRVYAAPLISWRANSPNPIQIYCAVFFVVDVGNEFENVGIVSVIMSVLCR